MAVSREKLYEEVWVEPMGKVAERYQVSGSFLARVCERLNVPRPPRGYWAKLAAGKKCKKPLLPDFQPGEELEWSRDGMPRCAPRPLPQPPAKRRKKRNSPPADRPSQHPLLIGAREYFDAARESDDGYLKPSKRRLVDLVLTKETLARGLELANSIFLALEDRGHRVVFPPRGEYFVRAKVDPREENGKTEYYRSLWAPNSATVVYIGSVAIGLTLFELSELVEVVWENGKYIRVSQVVSKKNRRYSPSPSYTPKRDTPSGRLCLQAFSPYHGTDWQHQWHEANSGDMAGKISTIVRYLEREAPAIASLLEKAEHKAALERQRWEAQRLEWQREEAERKRVKAIKDSQDQLFSIIENWAEAKRIEAFFLDAEKRAAEWGGEEQAKVEHRLSKARELLGGTDALERFCLLRIPANPTGETDLKATAVPL